MKGYEYWLTFDEETRKELEAITDKAELEDRFYKEHYYDLSTLVEKSGFSNYRSENNIFSFAMGHVILTTYSSSSFTVIASKEHSNEALHPELLVSLENDEDAKEIVNEVEKVKVFLQSGDPVVVSLAPSFAANYEGIGINGMRKALKQLGFFSGLIGGINSSLVLDIPVALAVMTSR